MRMINDSAEEATDLTASAYCGEKTERGAPGEDGLKNTDPQRDQIAGEMIGEQSGDMPTEELISSRFLFEPGIFTVQGDRPVQQDRFLHLSRDGLVFAAVLDGMGGMNGGEKAAECAREVLRKRFETSPPEPDMTGVEDWFRETFQQADRAAAELMGPDGSPLRGGSTVAAVLLKDGKYAFGSVGDSRIYLVRDGGIKVLTEAHNYFLRLNELLSRGEISDREYQAESVRGEALISFLGMGGLTMIDTGLSDEPLKAGDCLILCSDGIYRSLSSEQILALLEESGGSAALAALRLCSHACRLSRLLRISQDNATAVVLGKPATPPL